MQYVIVNQFHILDIAEFLVENPVDLAYGQILVRDPNRPDFVYRHSTLHLALRPSI